MSQDMVYEEVPRLTRRVGDSLLAGANNSTILLGRDRLGGVDSGYGSLTKGGAGAGAMHLIVGRSGENPSIEDDRATVYLSAKTDPDTAAGTASIGQSAKEKSAVVMRADCVRISVRSDLKISVGKAWISLDSSGKITLEGQISLGDKALNRMMLGDAFAAFWAQVIIQTPAGPASPLPPIPPSVFSLTNRVK